MSDNTGIEWADATWNFLTGCSRVSPGCDNCYMFHQYPRLRAMGVPGYQAEPNTVEPQWERVYKPAEWKRPRRIFVNSMSDLFHKDVPYPLITQAFAVMAWQAPQHTYMILTKRPGLAVAWWEASKAIFGEWPENVWIGTSVENQKYAPRLTVLARLPAPIRFVSVEPMLGPVDLDNWLDMDDLQWVIAGGESGPRSRPCETEWLRDLRDRTVDAGVPFFLKQLGGFPDKRAGAKAILDGQEWKQFP